MIRIIQTAIGPDFDLGTLQQQDLISQLFLDFVDRCPMGREIFGGHKVTVETYARAMAVFGKRMLIDLVSVMGNYAATAALLCAFDMHVHAEDEPLLPGI